MLHQTRERNYLQVTDKRKDVLCRLVEKPTFNTIDMVDRERHIEMDIADAIMERPVGFSVGNRHFFIYPTTLGKLYLLSRLFDELDVNKDILYSNPYLEAIRLCTDKREVVLQILSYSTFSKKMDVFMFDKIEKRVRFFDAKLSNEELATIFVLILTSDNTEVFIERFGLDKEIAERKRISAAKEDSSYISFGGNSTYGTLIDYACQRYGWTFDYVVWGISYTNLRMLMADAVTTIHLTSDEMKKLGMVDSREVIDANDPSNRQRIKEILQD